MNASRTVMTLSLSMLSVLMVSAWVPAARAGAAGDAGRLVAEPSGQPTEPSGQPTEPSAQPAEPLQVWLRGPFGRVLGGSPDAPATAPPLGLPLDTFVRRAPLVLETGEPSLFDRFSVASRPLSGTSPEEILSTGAVGFEGPDASGRNLIVATIAPAAGPTSQHAWLVEVPDREPPADGLYDVPAPDVVIESASGRSSGLAADGCYAYLCVEVGRLPPVSGVEALPVGVGEVVVLRLSDGSAITAWEGMLSPLGRATGETLRARDALTDTPQALVPLAGLAPPGEGEWLLDVTVVFDRERGWMRTVYRLMAG